MRRRYQFLGALTIEEDGQAAPVMRSDKGRALLAALIIRGKPQSRETLADLLWESETTAQSLTRLRILVSRVHKWVPELLVSRKQLSFQASPDTSIDLTALNRVLNSKDVTQLNEGLRLYKGDLLDGFYLEDSTRFNEWLLLERENLRRRVIDAYRRLCTSFAEQQIWLKGIDAAQRWLALDEFDEEALRFLMQVLTASGQIGVALQQYKIISEHMWEALGVKPDALTVALAQRLSTLQKEVGEGLAWDVIVGAHRSLPVPTRLSQPGQLPPLSILPYQRNMDFTGRRKALLHLARMLLPWPNVNGHFTRAAAITGFGGLGKTQLAVEFCYRYGRYFPGGVFWLNFDDAQNVAADVARVGSEQGMGLYREAEQLTLSDRVRQVRRAWQEAVPRLLVFDNCEDEALLAEWMPVTGGSRVLLTSRRSHWSHDLQIDERPLQVLAPPESVRFLRQLAPDLLPDEALKIASELGHLPLALQLAGGFLQRYRQVSADRYLLQLRAMGLIRHPSLQGRGMSYSPTGHELNVARTFAISFEQLDPADEIDHFALQLLARAACFAPGEPIPKELLIASVIQQEFGEDDILTLLSAEDGLARLITVGVLQNDASGRVILHRLLATFTAGFLDIDQNVRLAVESVLLNTLSTYLKNVRNLAIIPFSAAHLKHVTDNTFARPAGATFRLGILFGAHLRETGDLQNARRYLEQSLAAASKAYDINGQAEAWIELAKAQESLQEILCCSEQAEQLLRECEMADKAVLAAALHYKAWAYYQMGQAELAIRTAEEALDLCISTDSQLLLGDIMNLLGTVSYYSLGKFEAANPYLEKALAIFRNFGIQLAMSTVLNNMGESARLQGDFALAKELYRQALEVAQEIGHLSMERLVRNNLCGALVGLEKYDLAIAELEALIGEVPLNWRILSEVHRFLAEARLGRGEIEEALEDARQALTLGQAENNGVPYDLGRAWRVLGQVVAQIGRPIRVVEVDDLIYDAPACFAKSVEIFTKIDVPRDRALALWKWAEYELAQGCSEKGSRMWREARSILERLDLPLLLARMNGKGN
jgi:DNA-binding SARP family transcriptional activator/tetratricopeptide (TPR) repeat protein